MITFTVWLLISFSGDYISTQPVPTVPIAQFATREDCEALRGQIRTPRTAKLECFEAKVAK